MQWPTNIYQYYVRLKDVGLIFSLIITILQFIGNSHGL